MDPWRNANRKLVRDPKNWTQATLINPELRGLMQSLCTPPDHAVSFIMFVVNQNSPVGTGVKTIGELAGEFEGSVQQECRKGGGGGYGVCSHVTTHGGAPNLFMLCVCCHRCQ
jgi:hypothetical protein